MPVEEPLHPYIKDSVKMHPIRALESYNLVGFEAGERSWRNARRGIPKTEEEGR